MLRIYWGSIAHQSERLESLHQDGHFFHTKAADVCKVSMS